MQYRPSKKLLAKRARIKSPLYTVDDQMCFSFWHFGHGSKRRYPRGMPRLLGEINPKSHVVFYAAKII